MPSLKRNVSKAPDKTGFESYDGPNPPKQAKVYRGRIKIARVREASTGTIGLNFLVDFEAEKGSPDAQYDGYPAWVTLWLSDKEPNQAREKQFYRAVGVPDNKLDDVNVVHDAIDDGGEIKKVGGRKVVGQIVKVDMQTERYNDELQLKGDAIYPAGKSKGKVDPDEDVADPDDGADPDADLLDDAGDEQTYEEREAELADLKLPALRKIAKSDYDLPTQGKNAEALRADILEHEYPDDGEGEGDEGDGEGGDEEHDYAVVAELKLPALRKWAIENGGYEEADLKGVKHADILELLVDDEILPNPEPAF